MKSEVWSRKSEVGSPKLEVRSPKSGLRSRENRFVETWKAYVQRSVLSSVLSFLFYFEVNNPKPFGCDMKTTGDESERERKVW